MPSNAPEQDEVMPYAFGNEVWFFFSKGIPLGLSSLLNWGIPPLMSMIFAGHTKESSHLQASLGYARVWINCTVLMPTFGLCAYFNNVIPGCVGADREDRIPRYLHRSMLLTYICILPSYVLQFFSGLIMCNLLHVPEIYFKDIDEYCRWMVVFAILLVPGCHMDCLFTNLGYVKCATANSLFTGLGVDIACTYTLILRWELGVFGSALAQIIVQSSRIMFWLAVTIAFKLFRKSFVARAGAERIMTRSEICLFLKLAAPQMLLFFAGWLIFEFQLIAMTNIQGISRDALAAGAAWVQVESSLAAAQDGWITSASMRVLNLLGKQDPGAAKSILVFSLLGFIVVLLSNIPFVLYENPISEFLSNDTSVQEWLYQVLWVLVPHTTSRVVSIIGGVLFVPLGRGMLGFAITFVGFYCVGTPIACFVSFTDMITSHIGTKMAFCVGITAIAQTCITLCEGAFLIRLDWNEAGVIIHRRANMDKRETLVEHELGASMTEVRPREI